MAVARANATASVENAEALQQQLNTAILLARQESVLRDSKHEDLSYAYERMEKLKKYVARFIDDTVSGKKRPKKEESDKEGLPPGYVPSDRYMQSPGGNRYTPEEVRGPILGIPPMSEERRGEILQGMKDQCNRAVEHRLREEGGFPRVRLSYFLRVLYKEVSFRSVPPIRCSMAPAVKLRPPAVPAVRNDLDRTRSIHRLSVRGAAKFSCEKKASRLTSNFASTTRSTSLVSRLISRPFVNASRRI